jgi:hypothetical protein
MNIRILLRLYAGKYPKEKIQPEGQEILLMTNLVTIIALH